MINPVILKMWSLGLPGNLLDMQILRPTESETWAGAHYSVLKGFQVILIHTKMWALPWGVKGSVLIFYSCHKKLPQTGLLKTIHSLTVQKARSSKSRC